MEKSLSISKILKKRINKKSIYERLLTEEGAYAALSVGDLLYDYLRVDPEVVKTLDIIHPNDDLSNPSTDMLLNDFSNEHFNILFNCEIDKFASVNINANMVAIFGAIIPEPLQIPTMLYLVIFIFFSSN